jgi:hypothetical protein
VCLVSISRVLALRSLLAIPASRIILPSCRHIGVLSKLPMAYDSNGEKATQLHNLPRAIIYDCSRTTDMSFLTRLRRGERTGESVFWDVCSRSESVY